MSKSLKATAVLPDSSRPLTEAKRPDSSHPSSSTGKKAIADLLDEVYPPASELGNPDTGSKIRKATTALLERIIAEERFGELVKYYVDLCELPDHDTRKIKHLGILHNSAANELLIKRMAIEDEKPAFKHQRSLKPHDYTEHPILKSAGKRHPMEILAGHYFYLKILGSYCFLFFLKRAETRFRDSGTLASDEFFNNFKDALKYVGHYFEPKQYKHLSAIIESMGVNPTSVTDKQLDALDDYHRLVYDKIAEKLETGIRLNDATCMLVKFIIQETVLDSYIVRYQEKDLSATFFEKSTPYVGEQIQLADLAKIVHPGLGHVISAALQERLSHYCLTKFRHLEKSVPKSQLFVLPKSQDPRIGFLTAGARDLDFAITNADEYTDILTNALHGRPIDDCGLFYGKNNSMQALKVRTHSTLQAFGVIYGKNPDITGSKQEMLNTPGKF